MDHSVSCRPLTIDFRNPALMHPFGTSPRNKGIGGSKPMTFGAMCDLGNSCITVKEIDVRKSAYLSSVHHNDLNIKDSQSVPTWPE